MDPEELTILAETALLAAYDAGKAAADPATTPAQHHEALTACTSTSNALYTAIEALRTTP